MTAHATNSKRKLLAHDAVIEVPAEVAVCPYCGDWLYVQANGWTQRDDGTWQADLIDVYCHSMPDFEDDAWEEWWQVHSDMPYVYQLPVNLRIERWMEKRYDFAVE